MAARTIGGMNAGTEGNPPGTPPKFTDACPDGKCARCGGTSFRKPLSAGWGTVLALGPLFAFFMARKITECVTCGARYARG